MNTQRMMECILNEHFIHACLVGRMITVNRCRGYHLFNFLLFLLFKKDSEKYLRILSPSSTKLPGKKCFKNCPTTATKRQEVILQRNFFPLCCPVRFACSFLQLSDSLLFGLQRIEELTFEMLIVLVVNYYIAYSLVVIYFQAILMPCFALRELFVSLIPLECFALFSRVSVS